MVIGLGIIVLALALSALNQNGSEAVPQPRKITLELSALVWEDGAVKSWNSTHPEFFQKATSLNKPETALSPVLVNALKNSLLNKNALPSTEPYSVDMTQSEFDGVIDSIGESNFSHEEPRSETNWTTDASGRTLGDGYAVIENWRGFVKYGDDYYYVTITNSTLY